MAARDKAAKAGSAYQSVASSPYVRRIIQDAELRQNIRDAFDVSRRAYGRLANGKAPSKALMEDKKLQRDLREAAVSLRDSDVVDDTSHSSQTIAIWSNRLTPSRRSSCC